MARTSHGSSIGNLDNIGNYVTNAVSVKDGVSGMGRGGGATGVRMRSGLHDA